MIDKSRLQSLIANAKLAQALSELLNSAKTEKKSDEESMLIGQSGRLQQIERENRIGIITGDDYRREIAKITYAILDIISKWDDTVSPNPVNSPPTGVKKVLMLTANPATTTAMNLEKEHAAIAEKLQNSSDKVRLFIKKNIDKTAFKEVTEEQQPYILHFSGHGLRGSTGTVEAVRGVAWEDAQTFTGSGIVLQNEQHNGVEILTDDKLAVLFEYFKENSVPIEVVILNACYSESTAKVIAQYVPYVIGTSLAIQDAHAIEFSVGFYLKIAQENPVIEKAYSSGRTQAFLGGAQKEHFVLYKNGERI